MSIPRPVRIAACLAVSAVVVGTPAAAAQPTAEVPFGAKHSDECLSSVTEGALNWPDLYPPLEPTVNVTGSVDLHNPDDCAFILPPTAVAEFIAYSGDAVIDTHSVETLDSEKFVFVLRGTIDDAYVHRIDRVEVRVCHGSAVVEPGTTPADDPAPGNCGEPETFTPPQ